MPLPWARERHVELTYPEPREGREGYRLRLRRPPADEQARWEPMTSLLNGRIEPARVQAIAEILASQLEAVDGEPVEVTPAELLADLGMLDIGALWARYVSALMLPDRDAPSSSRRSAAASPSTPSGALTGAATDSASGPTAPATPSTTPSGADGAPSTSPTGS
jgi:hypothetical protein